MFDEAQSDPSLSKDAYEAQEARLRVDLLKAQYRRLDRADRALLVVVARIARARQGATINLPPDWMHPPHIKTMALGPPEGATLRGRPPWGHPNKKPEPD